MRVGKIDHAFEQRPVFGKRRRGVVGESGFARDVRRIEAKLADGAVRREHVLRATRAHLLPTVVCAAIRQQRGVDADAAARGDDEPLVRRADGEKAHRISVVIDVLGRSGRRRLDRDRVVGNLLPRQVARAQVREVMRHRDIGAVAVGGAMGDGVEHG